METDAAKSAIADLTKSIVQAYADCPNISHLDLGQLPSRSMIRSILEDLAEIFFPGYGRRQTLHRASIEYHVGDMLHKIHDELTLQIKRALRQDFAHCGRPADEIDGLAEQKITQFLRQLPAVQRMLNDDVQAAFDGDPAAKGPTEIVFSYPGLEAIAVYRIAHELHRLEVPLIPRVMTEIAHSRTGIDIHPGASIGRRFFIDHGTGVVIGETCEIGENVKLYQGVTLGALSFPKDDAGNLIRGKKRHPTLRDNVVVYANAVILGGETVIGERAIIGAGVWITASVPANVLVSMEKPNLKYRGPGVTTETPTE